MRFSEVKTWKKIRIVIGDKLTLFREGLTKILNEQPNMEVLYAAPTIRDCMEKIGDYNPDICIIDTYFTEPACLKYTQLLCQKYPKLKVIELTHSQEDKDLFAALHIGARAYLSKFIDMKKLIQSIELVHNGEIIISPPMAGKLLKEFSEGEEYTNIKKADHTKDGYDYPNPSSAVNATDDSYLNTSSSPINVGLSPREKEVLELLRLGKTNKELAEELFISENTVKVHLRNIMEKLNASNRLHAINIAHKKGLL